MTLVDTLVFVPTHEANPLTADFLPNFTLYNEKGGYSYIKVANGVISMNNGRFYEFEKDSRKPYRNLQIVDKVIGSLKIIKKGREFSC